MFNNAIAIKARILRISENTSSEQDKKDLITASHLLSLLISIYTAWSDSKKKMNKILKMFFGNRSEKFSTLSKNDNNNNNDNENNNENNNENEAPSDIDKKNPEEEAEAAIDNESDDDNNDPNKTGRTGRISADDYSGANEISCSLDEAHRAGEICPKCKRYKLFEIESEKSIRLVGHAPVTAFKFIIEKSRCICGALFRAKPPLEFKDLYEGTKYGPSALSTMVIYKYLIGCSFGSLEKIQKMAEIPIPSSTQANKIRDMVVPVFESILEVLKYLAANAYALGFDDTTIKLLTEKRLTKKKTLTNKGHGTAVIANDFDLDSNAIVLYDFDYNKHAGDVMIELLAKRERLDFPLLISDGLVSYDQCKKEGIDINCNAHARRKMVEEDPSLQSYVGFTIINCYKQIYKNEKFCKLKALEKNERMAYHIEKSSYYFLKIEAVFELVKGDLSKEKKDFHAKEFKLSTPIFPSEPNDDLFKVARYFLERKKSLTAVLSAPGAPLDTNYVERVIKSIIKIRRNSQFFENLESAKYSGNILTVLETTNYNKINAFFYTEFLLENKEKVISNPKNFLPWIYNKSDIEKELYWKGVNGIIKGKSNSKECSSLASSLGEARESISNKKAGFTSSRPPSNFPEYQFSGQGHSCKSSELQGSG
jgi:hypothetical protein